MAVLKWRLNGFDGIKPTFSREVVVTEKQMTELLQRLVARHLTECEIVEDTLSGSLVHLRVHRVKRRGSPLQLLAGSGYHYVAVAVT